MAASKRAVLIVEDESIVAHDIQRTLSDLGFDAFAIASSADEAMARSGERRPDVALMDIRIKGRLDGIKTAQLLQERFGIPIVYLTAHADDATLEKALRTNPYGYLLKPVKPAELRSAIEIALSRHVAGARPGGSEAAVFENVAPDPALRGGRAPRAGAVRRALEQILASPDFDAPRRSREFLRFIVEETLAGRGEAITQATLATQVFERKGDFDAIVDPIVRIQAGRLRRSLERYYLLAGKQDAVRIGMPKGTYIPMFRGSAPAEAVIARAVELPSAAAETTPLGISAGDSWPVVVVSGFDATGADSEVEALALEVGDELALELGRYRAVRVQRQSDLRGAEPTGGARFALEGRLRRDAEGLRITAHLVDRSNGLQVWGEEYRTNPGPERWSGSPDDVARVIAARVAAEEGVVVQVLADERRRLRPSHPTPCDTILHSYEFFLARDAESFLPAVEGLRRLLEVEPEYGPAWTRLARLYVANQAYELTATPTPIDEAITCARRGVRVDPASRQARCILGWALLVKGELSAGLAEMEQALRSSPRSLVYLEMIGCLMMLFGDWERGAVLSRSARERNPHCLPLLNFGMWAEGLHRGDYEQAYQAALEFGDPAFFWRAVMRASCLGLLGRTAEAKSELDDLLSSKPDFRRRGRTLMGHFIKFPEVMDPIVEGLARAGLKLA